MRKVSCFPWFLLLFLNLRQVRAIDPPPQLRHCRGLILFSTKGNRPLADILSGGGMYSTSSRVIRTDHND